MIDEVIKEQAEDYEMCCIADVYRDDVCTIPYAYSAQKLEQAFQAGAKANAIEWHDIKSHVLPKREIPKKYMPKANEKVMLKYHFYNETEVHYSDGYYDMFDFEFHIPNNPTGRIVCVIAWCELSQFKR